MTEEIKTLLIMLGSIAAILLIIVLFFGNKGPVRKFLGLFIEEITPETNRNDRRDDVKKSSNEPVVEMVKLVRKSDDRVRVFESDGSMHIVDPYFELEFVTRKGRQLKIACSESAYDKIPFNEEGSLTYKRNTLVKFKFYEGVIYNDMEQQNG